MSFDIGDIVMLKSGGPAMTITSVGGDKIVCTWYETYAGEYKHVTFAPATLKLSV